MPSTKKYYIVDDDPDDQQFLIEALTDNEPDVQCASAYNGQEAMKNLNRDINDLPHAIFLDQNMPGLTGKQCLLELKSTISLQHIPVIIYSTSFDEREIENVMQLGAFHFLRKNSSFNELKKELHLITARIDKSPSIHSSL